MTKAERVALSHSRDEDCEGFVDAQTECCTVCGVFHGGPACPECGGLAFHRVGCWQHTVHGYAGAAGVGGEVS